MLHARVRNDDWVAPVVGALLLLTHDGELASEVEQPFPALQDVPVPDDLRLDQQPPTQPLERQIRALRALLDRATHEAGDVPADVARVPQDGES